MIPTTRARTTLAVATALGLASPAALADNVSYSFYEVYGAGHALAGQAVPQGVHGTLIIDVQNWDGSTGTWKQDYTGVYGANLVSLDVIGSANSTYPTSPSAPYSPFIIPLPIKYGTAAGSSSGWGVVEPGGGDYASMTTVPSPAGFVSMVANSTNPFAGTQGLFGPAGPGSLVASDTDTPEFAVPGVGGLGWDTYSYSVTLSATQMLETFTWSYCTGDTENTCTGSEPAPGSQAHAIVWGAPPAVPVPAALPLFASALAALGAISRRRTRRT